MRKRNPIPAKTPQGSGDDSARPDSTPPSGADLEALRHRIDEVDRRLIEVLSDRARIVVEIGRAKGRSGDPIYVPHREQEVLARALANKPGPLSDRTIEGIYRELMSGSFTLELPLRVGYLGPPGSFSHIAAVRHFGSSVECTDLHAIDGVFEEVAAGRCHYGLVPYENSIGGSVTDTLDVFREHEVTIYAEALIAVSQSLLALPLLAGARELAASPRDGGAGALGLGLVVGAVDSDEGLALLEESPGYQGRRDPDHLAGDLGYEIGLGAGHHGAVGAHRELHGLRGSAKCSDQGGRNDGRTGLHRLTQTEDQPDQAEGTDQDGDGDEDLPARTHDEPHSTVSLRPFSRFRGRGQPPYFSQDSDDLSSRARVTVPGFRTARSVASRR